MSGAKSTGKSADESCRWAEAAAAADKVGILASPSATVEEGHLLRELAEPPGHREHRSSIRRRDFSDQDSDPVISVAGLRICRCRETGRDTRRGAISAVRRRSSRTGCARLRLAVRAISFATEEYEYFFDVAETRDAIGNAGLVDCSPGSLWRPAATNCPKPIENLMRRCAKRDAEQKRSLLH